MNKNNKAPDDLIAAGYAYMNADNARTLARGELIAAMSRHGLIEFLMPDGTRMRYAAQYIYNRLYVKTPVDAGDIVQE